MKIRSIPDLQSFIALKDRIIVDTYRGQVRIRSWPRKQSAATKAKNRNQIRWFAAAREMAKWAEPSQIALAKRVTKGTGLYPGDLQMMAAAANLIPVIHGDPVNYTKWHPRVDPVSFQGIRAPLAADQTIVANVVKTASWGLPTFQTTQFWTAGDPTHFVIPPGVTKVNVMAAGVYLGTTPQFIWWRIQHNDTADIHLQIAVDSSNSRLQAETGPFAVAEGDTFRAQVNSNQNGTLKVDNATWMTLEVLETDV